METMKKRQLKTMENNRKLTISDLVLVAILLAAGAVLKIFVGSVVNFFGMKPNFIIAMYCLAIMLIKPRVYEAAIIGLLAGGICQFLPGTPYINFVSEFLGAIVAALMIKLPIKIGKMNVGTVVTAFVTTLVSGITYTICLLLFVNSGTSNFVVLAAYVPIVFFTAVINCIIVQLLYMPIKAAMKKQ